MKNTSILPAIGLSLICSWSSVVYSAELTGSTLEDFFTAAIDYSPGLRIAEESLNIGSARKRAAFGRLLPQVNATANLSDNRRNSLNPLTSLNQVENFDGERYSLQLRQVLFDWQTFSQRNQANLVEDQLEAEYFGELATLLASVAEKYFNVLQADDALESINAELTAVSNQLAQIESFYDRQLVLITDLYQAQAALASAESEKIQLETELAVHREVLRSATGISAGLLFRLQAEAQIPQLENSINYWVQQALSGNHKILAQEFSLRAAEERISEKRGAYMPRVSLILQRQDSNVGFENAPISQSDNTYLGLDFTIPLYAGGSNRAAVSEAHSLQRIEDYELQQVQREVIERVRSAYLQVQSSEARTAAAQKFVESAVLSATAMQRGFELGTETSVDVLNALRDQFRAERDLQRARYEHVKFLLVLKQETGTLSVEDMLEVGSWLEAPEL